MADVRQLTFSIGYRINDAPIRRADDAVDDYQRNVVQTDRTMVRFGRTVQTTGQRMQTLGSRAVRSARDGQNAFESFNRRMKVIGGAVLGYFSFQAIKRAFTSVIRATAELEENTAKFNVVFGEFAQEEDKWAREFAKSVGRGVNETKNLLASNQNIIVGFGATRDQGRRMSRSIQELGVDLASMNDEADAETINKMTSALLGNHLAVKGLGIAITETSLAQQMQNLGIKGNFSDLDELTKMQLRFLVMTEQSKDAMGDAERNFVTFTSQLKLLKGNYSDAIAQGTPLNDQLTQFFVLINENFDVIAKFIADGIDVAAKGLEVFGQVMIFVNDNSEVLIPLLAGLTAGFAAFKVIGLVMSAIGPVMSFMIPLLTNLIIGFGAVSSGTLTFGAALATLFGPIGWTVLAIGALVAIGVAVVRNWDKIKEAGATTFDFLNQAGKSVMNFLGSMFEGWVNVSLLGPLNAILGLINKVKFKVPDFVPGIGGKEVGFNIPMVSSFSVPEFAVGTRNAPRGLGIINESPRGELVSFTGGERVRSAAEAGAITRNNTTTSNVIRPEINININGSNKSETSITKEVEKALDNYFVKIGIAQGVNL